MEKVKVLHILPSFGPGGAERLVVDLMEAMDRERFEVAAVSLYPESGTLLEREIRAKGLRVFYLNKRKGLDLRMIPQLYRLFRAFQPDVVHTHLYVLRYVLLPALLCRIPVRVHTVHSVAQKEVDWPGKLVHWIAFRLGRVVPVSISRQVAQTVKEVYGDNIHTPIIYNGIPTRRFIFSNKKQRDDRVVLIHIGRFAPPKNHLLLVDAFSLAIEKYPSMELWLVGDGPLRVKVKKKVEAKGLKEKVRFLGLRDDIPDLLAEASILVLPSDWEGVPLTVLEAMAAGKPVVATAVGGVPELVDEGKTGFLVPPQAPDALAGAILRLARDPELRKRMGEVARKRALERFDIRQTAQAYGELYLKLLTRK